MLGGDGDDAAVLDDGDGSLAMAEAIHPVRGRAAARGGVAGVVTVLNDPAPRGARPLALLDCVVAGDRRTVEDVLAGLDRGRALPVPLVGGHATMEAGRAARALDLRRGALPRPAGARNARAGDADAP